MSTRPTMSLQKPSRAYRDQGFSMVEMLLVIAIIGTVTAMALVAWFNEMPMIRADSAFELMEAQLRQARENAVDMRRTINVTFSSTGTMTTVMQTINLATTPPTVTGTTTLNSFTLDPNTMTYTVLTGVPDTPDAFGNTSATCIASSGICFNNGACGSPAALPCTIYFQGDGTVANSTGTYVNGTIFMGALGNAANPSNPQTERAVTILGATGRIKGYRYTGSKWY